MRIASYDLEVSAFNAHQGIVLCAAVKDINSKEVKVFRADSYKTWTKQRSDNRELVKDIADYLDQFDVLIGHYSEGFDKLYMNSVCVMYGLKPILKYKKSIDTCLIARRQLKLGRNTLASLADFLDLKYHKTPIDFKHWLKATLDGNKQSMSYICTHCKMDVLVLDAAYKRLTELIGNVDSKGSSR